MPPGAARAQRGGWCAQRRGRLGAFARAWPGAEPPRAAGADGLVGSAAAAPRSGRAAGAAGHGLCPAHHVSAVLAARRVDAAGAARHGLSPAGRGRQAGAGELRRRAAHGHLARRRIGRGSARGAVDRAGGGVHPRRGAAGEGRGPPVPRRAAAAGHPGRRRSGSPAAASDGSHGHDRARLRARRWPVAAHRAPGRHRRERRG